MRSSFVNDPTTIVRQMLCHGCVATDIPVKTAVQTLVRLQRLDCLCITRSKRTTITMTMEALLIFLQKTENIVHRRKVYQKGTLPRYFSLN